jgi:GDP-L-fucose synthase
MEKLSESIPYKRVVVTGGAGFLGRFIVERLQSYAEVEVFVPRSAAYNLVEAADVKRLFVETHPDLVIHLAAVVGGIGANQKNPGKFFYENLMMGVQLIEQARLHDVRKFIAVGTVCSYPKFTPTPFREDNLFGFHAQVRLEEGLRRTIDWYEAQVVGSPHLGVQRSNRA